MLNHVGNNTKCLIVNRRKKMRDIHNKVLYSWGTMINNQLLVGHVIMNLGWF